ncbi:MAG: ATP-binding protein [Chloroflexi bacterium]|nr:ATP-binding protein [Chloroflexota bacterium]
METNELEKVRKVARECARLTVFRGVLDDEVGRAFLGLLDILSGGRGEADEAAAAYGRAFALLAGEAELAPQEGVGDAWQDHLLDRLLADDNPFSRKAEMAYPAGMGASLLAAACHDLEILESLFRLDADAVVRAVEDTLGHRGLPRWDRFSPLSLLQAQPADDLKVAFSRTTGWSILTNRLAEHFRSRGAGDFGRFRAFRWVRRDGQGTLEGVDNPDPIQLDELIAYDAERELLVQNTEHFVAGYPANNVLLYGDRGTGKSSTVKALLNAYADRGLRLVEVSKQHLGDFPRIVRLLRSRGERFVLFVDDLSFDDNETHYKELKAILEGGLEVRPQNVLLYATSNRRHLVRERHADRGDGSSSDEIRSRDTVEEKLSLSDRFGITVTFLAPDQGKYLHIVSGLAAQRGIEVPGAELADLALKWSARHNGRSGRTARQFVDHLQAALALNTSILPLQTTSP